VEGRTVEGKELEGDARLTHVLPALPEIANPVSMTDEPPLVDPFNLVIEWNPMTTRFIGDGPVDIIEYQVILDQVEPQRTTPWIDGSARRALNQCSRRRHQTHRSHGISFARNLV
jgi:hypothetical protein